MYQHMVPNNKLLYTVEFIVYLMKEEPLQHSKMRLIKYVLNLYIL